MSMSESEAEAAWWDAYNMGRELEAESEGLDRGVWSAIMDASTCSFCAWADGRVIDGSIIPPAHMGCRCIVAYYNEADLLEDGTSSEEEFDSWGDGPPSSAYPFGRV